MSDSPQQRRDAWNASRFRPGETGGLYESYFLRANHPEKPLAFWIRYNTGTGVDRYAICRAEPGNRAPHATSFGSALGVAGIQATAHRPACRQRLMTDCAALMPTLS